jgi:hypothetical protein
MDKQSKILQLLNKAVPAVQARAVANERIAAKQPSMRGGVSPGQRYALTTDCTQQEIGDYVRAQQQQPPQ